jgi:hypothetical protein
VCKKGLVPLVYPGLNMVVDHIWPPFSLILLSYKHGTRL